MAAPRPPLFPTQRPGRDPDILDVLAWWVSTAPKGQAREERMELCTRCLGALLGGLVERISPASIGLAGTVTGTAAPPVDEGGGQADPAPPPIPDLSERLAVLEACRRHERAFAAITIQEELGWRGADRYDAVRAHLDALAAIGHLEAMPRGRFRAPARREVMSEVLQARHGIPAEDAERIAGELSETRPALPETPTATDGGQPYPPRGRDPELAASFPDLEMEAARRRATTLSNGAILTRAMVLDACRRLDGGFAAREVAHALGESDITRLFTHLSSLERGGELERVMRGRYRVRRYR
ncbi:MAG: hypothetical protein ABSH07_11940 [Candidatus Dormibacteria bacterium]|jgi:hypothetical protein